MTSARNSIANNGAIKDTVLFVSEKPKNIVSILVDYEKRFDKKIRALVLIDNKQKHQQPIKKNKSIDYIRVNTDSIVKIEQALKPYKHRLFATTCHSESLIPVFEKIIPHVPYLRTPDEVSLRWATDKLLMRQMLFTYDKKITPAFTIVSDSTDASIEKIEKSVGFPLVLKPTGLAQSLLVSQCYYPEELKEVLTMSLKKIEKIHKEKVGRGQPQMLVEQMMEGAMYSIDAYVDSRGAIYFCPLVYVETGKMAGFDDFFGYKRVTPVILKPHKQQAAREVAKKGIYALNLRSTTCHIELMKTEDGWKIIEIGPRMGGYRNRMYRLSFGINHALNDVLVRVPQRPIIPKKALGYSSVMQFFSKREGLLEAITGIKKIQGFESTVNLSVKKRKGDMCRFSRNGGTSVVDVALFNKDRSKLLADIRKLEQTLQIKVVAKKSRTHTG